MVLTLLTKGDIIFHHILKKTDMDHHVWIYLHTIKIQTIIIVIALRYCTVHVHGVCNIVIK